MSLNFWYYTLSTIAQTLASILGLGAVFSVLRLDRLTKNIADYKDRGLHLLEIKKNNLSNYRVPKGDLWAIIKDLEEFSNNYESEYRNNSGIDTAVKTLITIYGPVGVTRSDLGLVKDTPRYLRSFTEQREEMIEFIKDPALVTAFTIGLAVVLLSIPSISISSQTTSLFFVTVTLALLSVLSVIRAAWKIVNAIKMD